jgi:hypothetical protein
LNFPRFKVRVVKRHFHFLRHSFALKAITILNEAALKPSIPAALYSGDK